MSSPTDLDPHDGDRRLADEDPFAGDAGLELLLAELPADDDDEPVVEDAGGRTAFPEFEADPDRSDENAAESPADEADGDGGFRAGWVALGVSVVARALLFCLASLVMWSVLPAALHWQPTAVMSGSMEPTISTGDVVISRPIPFDHLTPGQVILVDDPDRPGELRLHRLKKITSSGLVLKGDANISPDSTPVKPAAVHGLAVLRIPYIAQPLIWVKDRQFVLLAVAGLLFLLTLRAAFWWRPEASSEDDEDDDVTTDAEPADESRRHRGRHRRPVVRLGVTFLVALAVMADPFGASKASAAFVKTTANPTNTYAANGYFSCSATIGATAPSLPSAVAYPLSERSGTSIADISGNANTGTASGSIGYNATGPCPSDGGRAMTFNGSNTFITSGTKLVPVPTTLSLSVWFKTSTGGGALAGFMNNQAEASATAYDRMIWLTDAGKLVFGAYTTDFATVITPGTYLDNQWHHVVATIAQTGSYIGMRIYVDGAFVIANTGALATATPYGYDGYFRVGHNVLTGWPNTSTRNYYNGALAFAVVYTGALTPTQIAGIYQAAPGATTVIEGETMPIVTSSGPAPFSQANYSGMTWRGGAHMVCACTAVGNSFTLSFYVPVAGTYQVLLVQTMNSNFPINSVAVDGTTVGSFDGYNAGTKLSPPVNYGSMSLTQGAHQLKLTVTGQNAASSGFVMSLDYMILR